MSTDTEFMAGAGLVRAVMWVPADNVSVKGFADVVRANHFIDVVQKNLVPDWYLEKMALKRRHRKLPEPGTLLGMRAEANELGSKDLIAVLDKAKEAVEEHHKQRYDAANENTPYEDSLYSGALSYGFYLLALAYYDQAQHLLEKAKDK